MDLFILTPIKEHIDEQYLTELKDINIIVDNKPKELLKVKGILNNNPKIIAIDIDFRVESEKYIDSKILKQIPNLVGIAISSTSFSWIDTEYLNKNKIAFSNCPNFSSKAVAEWGLMMSIMLSRKYPKITNSEKVEYTPELKSAGLNNRKVGIIGLGNIGLEFANLIEPFSESISYWSRSKKNVKFKYKKVADIFKSCDLIYFALVKDEALSDLIKLEYLNFLQPNTIITSAITLATEIHKEIIRKVVNGEVYGYGFEGTFDAGKPANILATQHYAWYTEESLNNNLEIWYKNILEMTKEANLKD